jgi:hypothetical protein
MILLTTVRGSGARAANGQRNDPPDPQFPPHPFQPLNLDASNDVAVIS